MRDDANSLEPLIDPLIDDVARAMTAARPVDELEGFADRVSARIQDAAVARAPRTWARAWLLVPAAACVLVIAVFLLRDTNVRPTTSAPATAVKKQDATPGQAAARSPQPLVPDTTGAMTGATEATARRTVRLTPDATPVQTFAGGTDPDLQPLTMAPIELTALDISPLVVAMPIEISMIAIERIEIAAMP